MQYIHNNKLGQEIITLISIKFSTASGKMISAAWQQSRTNFRPGEDIVDNIKCTV